MSVRRTVTVSIAPAQDARLRAFLETGRYRSVGEVLRSALRPMERDAAAALSPIERSAVSHEAVRD